AVRVSYASVIDARPSRSRRRSGRELDDSLDDQRGPGNEQNRANGAQQLTLVQATGEPGAEQRPRHGCGRTETEERPVDASMEMAEHPCDAEAEADREIRADRAERIRPDEPEQGADAERAQDQADKAAEHAD